MPNTPFIAVSQKIEDNDKRENLKNFFKENLPDEIGGVIRTSAANADKADIIRELENLNKKWDEIKNIEVKTIPQEIYNAGGIIKKYITDNIDKKLEKIVVNSEELKSEVLKYLKEDNSNILVRKDKDYFANFGVQG